MDFTKDCSRHNLILFLVPLIWAELFQQVYSLINTSVVSRVLDYRAVAVIGACSGFISLRGNLMSGMLFGCGIYIGKAVGSRNQNFFHQVFSAAFWYTLGLSMLGISLLPFTDIMLALANIPAELSRDAAWYLAISFAGSGCIALKLLLIVTLQSIGETKFFSFLAAAGVIINTTLVVLFIYVLHGSVASSALATILTNLMLAGFLYLYMRRTHPELLLLLFPPSISAAVWLELLKNGIAKTLYFMLGSLGKLVLQRSINHFSVEVIAGQSWAACLQTILFAPLGELGTASGVITGQNAGAGNKNNIQRYHSKLSHLMLLFGGTAVCLVYLAGFPTLQLLVGADKPTAVTQSALQWLQITVLAMPFCFTILYRNALQALGHYRQVVVLGALEFAGTCITAMVLVPLYGYPAAAFGAACSWLLQAALGACFFRHSMKGGIFLESKSTK